MATRVTEYIECASFKWMTFAKDGDFLELVLLVGVGSVSGCSLTRCLTCKSYNR